MSTVEDFMVSPYSTSQQGYSSPVILDAELGGSLAEDDLDFLNGTLQAPNSPAVLDEDILGMSMNYSASSASLTQKQHDITGHRPSSDLSNPSATSPETASSSQDSSSETSRRKNRKSSSSGSGSTRSERNAPDVLMMDDQDMSDWKADDLMMGGDGPNFAGFGMGDSDITMFGGAAESLKVDPETELSNRVMESHFDFESAASSPIGTGAPGGGKRKHSDARVFPATRPTHLPFNPNAHFGSRSMAIGKRPSQSSRSAASPDSSYSRQSGRDMTPLSAMATSHESSPSAVFNTSVSPTAVVPDFISGAALSQNPGWDVGFGYQVSALPASPPTSEGSPIGQSVSRGVTMSPGGTAPPVSGVPKLILQPTPLKSRVETQIPIKMTLHPMPAGATKLHLPPHTISKPKLLSKPPPSRSADTLELHTTLVCTSAMQAPGALERAFARAAGTLGTIVKKESNRSSSHDSISDEDDPNKPLNGGEVKICNGCILRERKRAARKKMKKVDEEESWARDEAKRVIVFNTQEVKDWQYPPKDLPSEAESENTSTRPPPGAMQVEAPMRIACYCRHQNEKLGFR
jgi:hypothetical protein